MTVSDLQDKKVYLLGYGVEGKATEKFLKTKIPTIEIGIGDASVNANYLEEQKNFDIGIRSPGLPKELVTIPYTTATNLFFSEVKGKTIGVTGTKGKSTTTSLIYHMLKEAGRKVMLAGNIGRPMLAQLLENNDEDTLWVVELSSYMLDDIEYSPDISVVVSLYSDHADYHGSVESYHKAKKNIVRYATADSIFIYNPAFDELKKWAELFPGKAVPYLDFAVSPESSSLIGEHNRNNIAAAATVVKELGVSELDMYKALKTFQPLPHRLENVGTYKGITYYDDAISTTPESTNKALDALPNVETLFVGGLDRRYNFEPLIEKIKEKQVKNIVFFPASGAKIKKLLDDSGYQYNGFETSSMQEAVKFAYDHTTQNMVCLLSTASPSYSVWKNFEEKGDQFQQYVKEYGEKDSQEESAEGTSKTGEL